MAHSDKIRVLIVDDSAVTRLVLADMIRRDPDLELAGAESNGRKALENLDALRPDVVVLDVEMPEMNGIETVTLLRARQPRLPVIMFSSYTEEGAAVTIEALTCGAADFVAKPSNTTDAAKALAHVREQLLPRIKILGRPRRNDARPMVVSHKVTHPSTPSRAENHHVELICVAVSTGGPRALEVLLTPLPASFPVPIVIVQHMPPTFTRHLAERLASLCAISVKEVQNGATLHPGTALLAPGDFHVVIKRSGERALLVTNQDPPENSCRPSADVLFRSAAKTFGPGTLAVVLTGMGHDGLAGSEEIHHAGGRILVQDEASSVVWGMPGSVARANLADKIMAIDQLSGEIMRRLQP
jgi:two-component system chemotaxis response regulator CheB